MKQRHGFTLTELLVVIAVIAILASILLPTLAKSKTRAQAVFCLNNTKQLTLAWMTYADDHDGRLAYNLGASSVALLSGATPMSLNWANNVLNWELDPDNTNVTKLVNTGLGPYTSKAANIYRCPSDDVLSLRQEQAGWSGPQLFDERHDRQRRRFLRGRRQFEQHELYPVRQHFDHRPSGGDFCLSG